MERIQYSVSDIVNSIKTTLEFEYSDLEISGEITNISSSAAGHYYFNLSDKNSSISAAIFKMDALRNPIIRGLKDGDQVIIQGPLSVYTKRGTFQVIAKKIFPAGKGNLAEEFKKLKEKLYLKGYFNEENKKKIPAMPKDIVVITALKGAALQDFLNVMKRRCHWYNIIIIPCTTQGVDCGPSVIKAIKQANKLKHVDVIVITRGGGAAEDLWGFNNESLVKEVFDCKIPVISAIGHQVDFTLLDYVADYRAETPTAAAEILSQPQTLLDQRLKKTTNDLNNLFKLFKSEILLKIDKLNPKNILHLLHKKIHQNEKKLLQLEMLKRENSLGLADRSLFLDELLSKLVNLNTKKISEFDSRITSYHQSLKNLNPKNVLERGYTILSDKNGKLLTSQVDFDKINQNEDLRVEFSDGFGLVRK